MNTWTIFITLWKRFLQIVLNLFLKISNLLRCQHPTPATVTTHVLSWYLTFVLSFCTFGFIFFCHLLHKSRFICGLIKTLLIALLLMDYVSVLIAVGQVILNGGIKVNRLLDWTSYAVLTETVYTRLASTLHDLMTLAWLMRYKARGRTVFLLIRTASLLMVYVPAYQKRWTPYMWSHLLLCVYCISIKYTSNVFEVTNHSVEAWVLQLRDFITWSNLVRCFLYLTEHLINDSDSHTRMKAQCLMSEACATRMAIRNTAAWIDYFLVITLTKNRQARKPVHLKTLANRT
ncbi:uncharacterized protein DEA37_0005925 [Paragonimus westermani]|uniref:Uncharacterized protein n=1 Tax=Paragonimus westermani TaxID=34504 RepID=A0A5J4P1I7_9TREM|nr:uncharacterized protein DEA37_0005925 [Paragonimus westermani]